MVRVHGACAHNQHETEASGSGDAELKEAPRVCRMHLEALNCGRRRKSESNGAVETGGGGASTANEAASVAAHSRGRPGRIFKRSRRRL